MKSNRCKSTIKVRCTQHLWISNVTLSSHFRQVYFFLRSFIFLTCFILNEVRFNKLFFPYNISILSTFSKPVSDIQVVTNIGKWFDKTCYQIINYLDGKIRYLFRILFVTSQYKLPQPVFCNLTLFVKATQTHALL